MRFVEVDARVDEAGWDAMTAPVLADCAGLWRRTLLIGADGSRDATPGVQWLQGVSVYVDSRGFAGRLHQRDDVFEWHRDVEVEAPGPFPDAGAMHWDGDTLVETGVYEDYVEHWVRDDVEPTRGWGLVLGSDDRRALLMRVGDVFGWADGAGVVIDAVGSPHWDALAVETFTDRIQANGVIWIIHHSEGNLNS